VCAGKPFSQNACRAQLQNAAGSDAGSGLPLPLSSAVGGARIVGRSCAKGEGGDRDREESKPQLGPQAGASSQKKFSTAHADAVCRSWMAYLPYDLPILGECGLHRKNSDSEDKKSRGS